MGLTKQKIWIKKNQLQNDFQEIAKTLVETNSVCSSEEEAEVCLIMLKYVKDILLPKIAKVKENPSGYHVDNRFFLKEHLLSSIFYNKALCKDLAKNKTKSPVKKKLKPKAEPSKPDWTLKLNVLGYRKIRPFVSEEPEAKIKPNKPKRKTK